MVILRDPERSVLPVREHRKHAKTPFAGRQGWISIRPRQFPGGRGWTALRPPGLWISGMEGGLPIMTAAVKLAAPLALAVLA
ncbi:MAG: hypothetical protein P8Y48_06125, partial [Novosphingobium sp.]